MADSDYDVVIIGSGPGGYVAGIRAGQLGLKTAVVERDEVGGVCLNWGCIPSKALLRNAEILSLFKRGDEFGFTFDNLQADFGVAVDRSRKVVQKLTQGVAFLLKKNKVDLIQGSGSLRDANTVEVAPEGRILKTKSIIIATGARARSIPPLPIDEKTVITSRQALELREVPKRVVIVGGGATGAEFSYIYNSYGAKVTLVEMLPRILPKEDEEISATLERAFSKQGIEVMTGAQVKETRRDKDGLTVVVDGKDGVVDIPCDKVLSAIGVDYNTEGLGLDKVGIKLEKGAIVVDDHLATTAQGVYAIGDVTGKMLLAHVAMAQGVAVVERIAGIDVPSLNYTLMPRATYCVPQVASFGLTEAEAREQGYEVKVGKFPLQASGKALALAETEGMVKVVADAKLGEILGGHAIGHEATELMGELAIANLLEGTTKEVGWLVHAHPTMSEAVKEAALAADGEAIHI
ncbi:MAG: dihydrolipoamide dehydrogenase [Chloroflexi bacterium]|jgi:dihydrolipoamide dehydrogenase|nr:MAG: dihydrolipoamide dehydrogenase [Chloroflexota bacterium]